MLTPLRRGRRWPACCARGTPARTPPPTTAVLDRALSQVPVEQIETIEILLRADTAGATHGLADFCRAQDMRCSVGDELTEPVLAAILELPEDAWVAALDQDGSARANGEVAARSATASRSVPGRRARG